MLDSSAQSTVADPAHRPLLRKAKLGLALLAMAGGIAAFAQMMSPSDEPLFTLSSFQTTSTYDPGKFCYLLSGANAQYVCHDTREDAEAGMRSDPQFNGIGQYLERMGGLLPIVANDEGAAMQDIYRIQYRQPVKSDLMYRLKFGDGSTAVFRNDGCQTASGDTHPDYAGWCGSEEELKEGARQYLASTKPAGCTIGTPRINFDYLTQPLHEIVTVDSGNPQRGIIANDRGYGDVYRSYATDITCPNPQGGNPLTETTIWTMQRHKTFVCQSGFVSEGMAPAIDGNYCAPSNKSLVTLLSPVTQTCDIVPGDGSGPRPRCNPATGDKMEAESDFEFAGRPFNRYYHSTRQFRTNPQFAEAWTHSYADRISGYSGASFASVVGEDGYFELFRAVSANRFRSGPSGGRQLDYLTQPVGTVRWRLREADGETREFDFSGRLVAIRNPAAPLNDVTITYTGNDPLASTVSTVTDRQGRVLRFEYANRMLARIVKPDGTSVAYGYDTYDNLVSVDYGQGQVRQYHYTELSQALSKYIHHLTGITSETGQRRSRFTYNDQGKLTRNQLLGTPNEVTEIAYDSDTQSTVTTAEGAIQTYTIAPGLQRRVTSVATAGMGTSAHEYDPDNGLLTTVTDRHNVKTRYEYDSTHRDVSAIVEADATQQQRRTEFVRDPQTRLVTEQRVLNNANTLVAKSGMVYNGRLQVSSATRTSPDGALTRTSTTTYCEDADVAAANSKCPILGLVKRVDGPLPNTIFPNDVTRFEYRPADAPNCASAPTECSWRKGDLWKTINPKNQVTEILAYDGAGRVRSVKDANNVISDIEYNARGWVTARKVRGTNAASEDDDRILRMEYYADGTLKKTIRSDGTYLEYKYDAANRLTQVVDPDGNTITYTLDEAGNRVAENTRDASDTLVRTLSRVYNDLGQLASVTDANTRTTHFEYDNESRLTVVIDPLTHRSERQYDALGRLTRDLRNTTSTTDSATTVSTYDPLDRVTEVLDPNEKSTTYEYTAFGEVSKLTSPDSGVTDYTYDEAGRLVWKKDANAKETSYLYDPLGRLTRVDFADNVADEGFAYDAVWSDCYMAGETFSVGRLTQMSDGGGTTVYCYNRFGDLVRKIQRPSNEVTLTFRWVYAANGRLEKTIYPDNTEVDYLYDTQGRVTEIGVNAGNGREVLLKNATYHPFGPVQRWLFGNNLEMRRTLDLNYQPDRIEDGPEQGTPVGISLGYTFDGAGNLTVLRNGKQASPALRSFDYDGMNRLVETRDGSGLVLETYDYDRTGNRTTAGEWIVSDAGGGPGGGGTPSYVFQTTAYSYASDSHRLLAVGDEPREYDAAGNLKKVGTASAPGGYRQEFTYNAGNRMGAVTSGGAQATYGYNARGERVRRTAYGVETFTMYDEQGRWLGDFNANGTPIRMAIWLGGLPVGLLTGSGGSSKLYYLEADALGSPRIAIDPTRGTQGTVVWRWDLAGEAFGKGQPEEDPDGDNVVFNLDLRFPGQQFDSFTGLHYNYFRDYDPGTGRYVQSDPIGLGGGVSTYGYVQGNPVAYTDRLGLACDGRGCWNTPGERQAAASGNWRSYYRLACSGGDYYACRAGEVAANEDGFFSLTRQTNARLQQSISKNQPDGMTCSESRKDLIRKMEAVRRELAQARVDQLSQASPTNPLQVDRSDVADFHYDVFERNGASRDTFGGDIWDFAFGWTIRFGGYDWCPSPSCRPRQ
ncbi:MAG: RHS repeat protein [Xanthomonadaceae bacterium]|nr:RHS repeat protein [Xanthomonadaceae bacterium]